MNNYNTQACKVAGFLIILFGIRVSSGQLSCYFGSVDQAKRTQNESLLELTCAAKYTHRMNMTNGSSLNISYSLIHPEASNVSTEDWKFCVVFVRPDSTSDHSCDHDHVCQSEGIRPKFNYKGQLGRVFCCKTDLCNTRDRAADEDKTQSLICYSDTGADVSCGQSCCMNQTTVALNGTTQYKHGCATEKGYDPNSPVTDECQETTSSSGRTTTCLCTGNRCNRPATTPDSPTTPATTPASLLYAAPLMLRQAHARSWGFIGTVAAVILLVVLFVVLVVLVVRRFRDHRAQHVTYTYTQLTADLAEERDADDEYMLIG